MSQCCFVCMHISKFQGASKGLTTIQEFMMEQYAFNISQFGVFGASKVGICVIRKLSVRNKAIVPFRQYFDTFTRFLTPVNCFFQRGTTTWLLSALDDRVRISFPMVFPLLKFQEVKLLSFKTLLNGRENCSGTK